MSHSDDKNGIGVLCVYIYIYMITVFCIHQIRILGGTYVFLFFLCVGFVKYFWFSLWSIKESVYHTPLSKLGFCRFFNLGSPNIVGPESERGINTG
jgi:hypothetical protein